MTNCNKCGAPMILSKANKMYCASKCWLDEEERQVKPNSQGQPVNAPIVKVGNTRTQKDIDIIRQCCIKAACKINNIILDEIIPRAIMFENWILR